MQCAEVDDDRRAPSSGVASWRKTGSGRMRRCDYTGSRSGLDRVVAQGDALGGVPQQLGEEVRLEPRGVELQVVA